MRSEKEDVLREKRYILQRIFKGRPRARGARWEKVGSASLNLAKGNGEEKKFQTFGVWGRGKKKAYAGDGHGVSKGKSVVRFR